MTSLSPVLSSSLSSGKPALGALPPSLASRISSMGGSPSYLEIEEESVVFQEIFHKQIISYAQSQGMGIFEVVSGRPTFLKNPEEGVSSLWIGQKADFERDEVCQRLNSLAGRCSFVCFATPSGSKGTESEPHAIERLIKQGREVFQSIGALAAPSDQQRLGEMKLISYPGNGLLPSYRYEGKSLYTDLQMSLLISEQIERHLPPREGASFQIQDDAKQAFIQIYLFLHREGKFSPDQIASEIKADLGHLQNQGNVSREQVIGHFAKKQGFSLSEEDLRDILDPAFARPQDRALHQVKAVGKLAWRLFVASQEGVQGWLASHLHARFGKQWSFDKKDFQYLVAAALTLNLYPLSAVAKVVSAVALSFFLGSMFLSVLYTRSKAILTDRNKLY